MIAMTFQAVPRRESQSGDFTCFHCLDLSPSHISVVVVHGGEVCGERRAVSAPWDLIVPDLAVHLTGVRFPVTEFIVEMASRVFPMNAATPEGSGNVDKIRKA